MISRGVAHEVVPQHCVIEAAKPTGWKIPGQLKRRMLQIIVKTKTTDNSSINYWRTMRPLLFNRIAANHLSPHLLVQIARHKNDASLDVART
jgi:hypothetical protein